MDIINFLQPQALHFGFSLIFIATLVNPYSKRDSEFFSHVHILDFWCSSESESLNVVEQLVDVDGRRNLSIFLLNSYTCAVCQCQVACLNVTPT